MKYIILVLLLLTFGCTQQAVTETGNVTDDGTLHPPSDAADAANDSSLDDNESTSTETTANESEVPTISNPDWGTECEYSSECGTFKEMKDCVKGHCVDIECKFKSDCKEKDHCFNGKCYLEDELYAEFTKCGVNEECDTTCVGCKSGKRSCIITGWSSGNESGDYYICAECTSDYSCSQGYACVNSYCVKGPN